MRFEDFEWLAAIIEAHPKQTVEGRTRLQKTVRLLQRLGMPTEYRFAIHHYGPYSEAVQSDISLLRQMGLLEEEGYALPDGKRLYKIRRAGGSLELPTLDEWRPALEHITKADAVILELAATYDSFREGGCSHPEALVRLQEKKGAKCAEGREARALQLLQQLNLPAAE